MSERGWTIGQRVRLKHKGTVGRIRKILPNALSVVADNGTYLQYPDSYWEVVK